MEEREENENMILTGELIQGLYKRIGYLEKDLPVLLKQSLENYNTVLIQIAQDVKTSAKRYNAWKMESWSGKLESFVGSMPKVMPVKHSHHFEAWTKNMLIGLTAVFPIGSLAAALYLNHKNGQLSGYALRTPVNGYHSYMTVSKPRTIR